MGFSTNLSQAYAQTVSIKEIQGAVDIIKKELNLPKKLDDETLATDVQASSNRIIYKYSLVNYNADQITETVFNDNLRPGLVKNYCENADMSGFKDNNISADYIYYGADKKVVSAILITASDCK